MSISATKTIGNVVVQKAADGQGNRSVSIINTETGRSRLSEQNADGSSLRAVSGPGGGGKVELHEADGSSTVMLQSANGASVTTMTSAHGNKASLLTTANGKSTFSDGFDRAPHNGVLWMNRL